MAQKVHCAAASPCAAQLPPKACHFAAAFFEAGRFGMASALLWPYSAENRFLIPRLSHSAECDKRYFHRRGRGGKRQLPRLFPRGNSHAAGALRHGSQHDPLSHRCAMPDFPLSSLRASSPRSGWKSFLKGRAKSTAESLLMMPNTLATGFKPWLPPSGKLARERLRGRARLAGAAPHPALRATFPRWVKA